MTYCIGDPVPMALKGPDNASCVRIYNQDVEVITHHTQHGAAKEGEVVCQGWCIMVYMYVQLCMCMQMYACMYVNMYVCICVCMYVL